MKHKAIIAVAVVSIIAGGYALNDIHNDISYHSQRQQLCEEEMHRQIWQGLGWKEKRMQTNATPSLTRWRAF